MSPLHVWGDKKWVRWREKKYYDDDDDDDDDSDRTGVPETRGAEGSGVRFRVAAPVDVGAKARVIGIELLVARSPPPVCAATQDVQL